MNNVEMVEQSLNHILDGIYDATFRRMAYIHLYGVAQASVLLAKKRGLNEELCIIAALLHDLYTYKNNTSKDHAQKGALLARELLDELQILDDQNVDVICNAIYHHSDKAKIHDIYSEVLKDADVLQRALYDGVYKEDEKERFYAIQKELNIAV